MQLARVCGQVISTKKAEKLMGFKILVCQPIDMVTFKEKGAPFVSIDSVGAGDGELVMCVSGSSSRQTSVTDARPVDNCIVAIIDSVDILGERCFDKADPSVMPATAKEEKALQAKDTAKQPAFEDKKETPQAQLEKERDADFKIPKDAEKKNENREKTLEASKAEEKRPELIMTDTRPKPKKPSDKKVSAQASSKDKSKEEKEAEKIIQDIMKKLDIKEEQSAKPRANEQAKKKPNHSANNTVKNTKAANKPNNK